MTPAAMPFSGGCLCRAVRYRIEAEPLLTRICWCRDCQFLAAGSGTVNACFASRDVHLEGLLSDFCSMAASGNVMHRRFCSHCGTPVSSQSAARPHLIFIRAGTLDDPSRIQPAAVIWTASAPCWAAIDPTLPYFAAQPPPLA